MENNIIALLQYDTFLVKQHDVSVGSDQIYFPKPC